MAAASEQDTVSIPAESANETREDLIEAHFMDQVGEPEVTQAQGYDIAPGLHFSHHNKQLSFFAQYDDDGAATTVVGRATEAANGFIDREGAGHAARVDL